jgi:hypothetical protein
MVHDKWSLQQGRDSNSRPLGHESSPLPLDHGVLPVIASLKKNSSENLGYKELITQDYHKLSQDD